MIVTKDILYVLYNKNMDIKNRVGKKIQEARKNKGINQRQLAEIC